MLLQWTVFEIKCKISEPWNIGHNYLWVNFHCRVEQLSIVWWISTKQCSIIIIIIIIRFLINMQVLGQYSHQWAPFQIAARLADLTPDLQVSLSWGSIATSFHCLQSLSVNCFQAILGLPGPRFSSTCTSKAVLTALLEHSTC